MRSPDVHITPDPRYCLDDPERHWWRAHAKVSLRTTSFDADGEPTFHRRDAPRVTVNLIKCPIVRRTPRGVFVSTDGAERFVMVDARKRFACPTVQEALTSLFARYERRRRILVSDLAEAEALLEAKGTICTAVS